MKRIVVAADFHCGNRVGLTPPAWQDSPETGPEYFRKFAKFQREVWNYYASELAALQPVDYFFFIGDAVDGKNERSGGTELINTDRIAQAEMAAACINEAHAREVYMVFGCLTAGHRILTDDLRWVSVETLKPGDGLLAFEESGNGRMRRRLIGSTVLSNVPFESDVYDLILSDGKKVTANGEHRFLLRRGGRQYDWVSVEHLHRIAHPTTPGFGKPDGLSDYFPMPFPRTIPVWDEDRSYEAGYLAGFFDGEGTVNQPVKIRERNGRVSENPEYGLRVTAVQKDNIALAVAVAALEKLGFRYPSVLPHDNRKHDIKVLNILGGIGSLLQFLGQVRPARLLKNFKVEKLGSIKPGVKDESLKIVDVRKAGRQIVYGLQTTSKTYISDGFLSHNTPYHTGVDEDWESVVAKNVGAEISGREFIGVEGVMFDLAHYVGGSQAPYGSATAIARDLVWNIIWARDGKQPNADCIIRGHTHRSVYLELFGKSGESLPALQGYGSKFGVRKCRGTVDIGFMHLDVENGEVNRCPHILDSPLLQIEPRILL
jgi:hypothetical protein